MKKFAIFLLAIVMVVATFALVACKDDNSEDESCKHKITDEFGILVDCRKVDFEAGVACSLCGEIISGADLVAAVEHKTTWTLQVVDATCTEKGLTEGKECLLCHQTIIAQEEIPALGHNVVAAAATDATCKEPAYSAGEVCDRCGEYFSGHQEVGEPLGHDFSHGNYFTYVECIRECGTYGKLKGGNAFETLFVYDFDDTKKQAIDEAYQAIEDALEQENVTGEKLDELFEIYDDYVGYVQAQYQFARVLNDITYDKASRDEFSAMSEYYNTTISRYYGLFKEIHDSDTYRDFFYQDWTQDEIEEVLALAESYDLDSQNAVDEIIELYEDLLNNWPGSKATEEEVLEAYLTLYDLYDQLVKANNSIATTADYDNYMSYAYEKVYERDYKPEDVIEMREYVKEYIGPIVADVASAYEQWSAAYQKRGGWASRQSQLYYSQFVGNWMWGNPDDYLSDAERLSMILDSRKSISDYFNFLSAGDSKVDFQGAMQNLFKTGTFFLGKNTNMTAYTWYIFAEDTPILVFGGDSDYQDAFTFIHEFGHYYQFVHNGRLSVAMDHDETQSQGNEMLFLAWLRANLPKGMDEGFEILELEQLINMLGSIVMSTAVDEFEYLVYTGATTYNDQPIEKVTISDAENGEREVIDYGALYETILVTYWEEIGDWFNTDYWMYATFDNAAYYISYAMSALPCLELYAKAGNDGLEAARASYLKLFTFSSNDEFMDEETYTDSDGEHVDRFLKDSVTYQNILNWAGLKGPFQEELYQVIETYFESRA